MFLSLTRLKITLEQEKENVCRGRRRAEEEKKAMFVLIVFILTTLRQFFVKQYRKVPKVTTPTPESSDPSKVATLQK